MAEVTDDLVSLVATNGREETILRLFEEVWAKDGEIEMDEGTVRRDQIKVHPTDPDLFTIPVVSEGEDNGAYVRAWVWVDFDGTDLDKNAEEADDEDEGEDEDDAVNP